MFNTSSSTQQLQQKKPQNSINFYEKNKSQLVFSGGLSLNTPKNLNNNNNNNEKVNDRYQKTLNYDEFKLQKSKSVNNIWNYNSQNLVLDANQIDKLDYKNPLFGMQNNIENKNQNKNPYHQYLQKKEKDILHNIKQQKYQKKEENNNNFTDFRQNYIEKKVDELNNIKKLKYITETHIKDLMAYQQLQKEIGIDVNQLSNPTQKESQSLSSSSPSYLQLSENECFSVQIDSADHFPQSCEYMKIKFGVFDKDSEQVEWIGRSSHVYSEQKLSLSKQFLFQNLQIFIKKHRIFDSQGSLDKSKYLYFEANDNTDNTYWTLIDFTLQNIQQRHIKLPFYSQKYRPYQLVAKDQTYNPNLAYIGSQSLYIRMWIQSLQRENQNNNQEHFKAYKYTLPILHNLQGKNTFSYIEKRAEIQQNFIQDQIEQLEYQEYQEKRQQKQDQMLASQYSVQSNQNSIQSSIYDHKFNQTQHLNEKYNNNTDNNNNDGQSEYEQQRQIYENNLNSLTMHQSQFMDTNRENYAKQAGGGDQDSDTVVSQTMTESQQNSMLGSNQRLPPLTNAQKTYQIIQEILRPKHPQEQVYEQALLEEELKRYDLFIRFKDLTKSQNLSFRSFNEFYKKFGGNYSTTFTTSKHFLPQITEQLDESINRDEEDSEILNNHSKKYRTLLKSLESGENQNLSESKYLEEENDNNNNNNNLSQVQQNSIKSLLEKKHTQSLKSFEKRNTMSEQNLENILRESENFNKNNIDIRVDYHFKFQIKIEVKGLYFGLDDRDFKHEYSLDGALYDFSQKNIVKNLEGQECVYKSKDFYPSNKNTMSIPIRDKFQFQINVKDIFSDILMEEDKNLYIKFEIFEDKEQKGQKDCKISSIFVPILEHNIIKNSEEDKDTDNNNKQEDKKESENNLYSQQSKLFQQFLSGDNEVQMKNDQMEGNGQEMDLNIKFQIKVKDIDY